jgi:hypothetical protein
VKSPCERCNEQSAITLVKSWNFLNESATANLTLLPGFEVCYLTMLSVGKIVYRW